jgi:YVTN family beta-propeller protein
MKVFTVGTAGLVARVGFVVVFAGMLASQPSGREQVGKLQDGSFLLPNGWRIQPVGTQVPLDTLPLSTALSRDGKFLLVLNAGYRPPSISVISTENMRETARVPVADAWLGLAFSPDGRFVYAGGAAHYAVAEFTWSASGELKPSRELAVAPGTKPADRNFIGDVAVSPDGRLLYAADLYHDSVVVINPQTQRVEGRIQTGRRPYRILFHPDGKSIFVSSWADAAVFQYDALSGAEINRVRLGPHTTDMVISTRKPEEDQSGSKYRLFVTAANTNNVFTVGIDESKGLKVLEVLNVGLSPRQPAGMTPSALALSPDQTRLYVVCSDANSVAVADVSEERSRLAGFVPAGWYPTAARSLADNRLLILNGRGLGSYPGHHVGPIRPRGMTAADARKDYVAYVQTGTMSVVDPLTDEALAGYTRAAMGLSPYRDAQLDTENFPGDSVLYSKPGKPSPIEHVLYIVKENRTYDQILGKLGKGNGDPSLTLFDESVAPNHYKLAREFVLFDNFYVNADVSADGHNWSSAAIAPDFTQRTWQGQYAGRLKPYLYEGGEPANTPPAGYIWSNARSAGLAVRNYGQFVENRKQAGADGVQIEKVTDPSMAGITNLRYRGFDVDYTDVDRAKVFLEDLKQFETSGSMPRFMFMRLGNDHTDGLTAGKIAPLSMFADNDYALGTIVEAVSKSRFWPKTAIFVLEDDAQNGPDHVDSHRSPMFAISPYTRRGIVDSSMYNTTSVLRTMELILGLRPMTQFDAASRPLTAAFASAPNNAPYASEAPRISLTQRNAAQTALNLSTRSARLDFQEADRNDDDELNEILWLAIKGTTPPPPVRSFFSRP